MSFTRQQAPLGLGHAVWCAREIVGDEPFAVLLPDMISRGETGCLSQMMDVYRHTGGNVIAVEECDPAETHQYGIVGVGESVGDAFRITSMVEKPKPADAPSNLYISGRYILQPGIFRLLEEKKRGAGNEIQLTDAMVRLAEKEPFYGCRFKGRTFDCGAKLGFLAANIAFALDRPDLGRELRAEIAKLLG
jgi:UTP--glucose-1-phosphate uridylyltransferase